MAEFIMKDLVRKAGRENEFEIASVATSTEEIGNPVYPPARRKLAEHGIRCDGHAARQLTRRDYAHYDLLIGMDSFNIRNMLRMCGGDPDGKIHLLMEFAPIVNGKLSNGKFPDVADPWYTDDFDATWRDCLEGCSGLLQRF